MFDYTNPLDAFLTQCALAFNDEAPTYFVLSFVSRWTAGDSEQGTNRNEELLVDESGEVFVLMGDGGPNTFWGGCDGLKMLILPREAARHYLTLRTLYDEANVFPESSLDPDEDTDEDDDLDLGF